MAAWTQQRILICALPSRLSKHLGQAFDSTKKKPFGSHTKLSRNFRRVPVRCLMRNQVAIIGATSHATLVQKRRKLGVSDFALFCFLAPVTDDNLKLENPKNTVKNKLSGLFS